MVGKSELTKPRVQLGRVRWPYDSLICAGAGSRSEGLLAILPDDWMGTGRAPVPPEGLCQDSGSATPLGEVALTTRGPLHSVRGRMITVQDALRLVLEDLPVLGCERAMLRQAGRRVLGQTVVAGRDIPPFRNSAMDGYAVRAADVAAVPARLRVLETVGAGTAPSQAVAPGTATKIMTGGVMPDDADAVVKVEDTTEEGGHVVIAAGVRAGTNVRQAGEDMRVGETVLEPGRVLRPADIGLLASLSIASVLVRRQPRVAILSTGDELVDVGEASGPGKIVNSNA